MTRTEAQQNKLVAMLRNDAYEAATIAKHYADENKVLRRERDQARSAISAATNAYEVASSIAKSCIEDTNKLRAFASAIMEAWPEGGIEGDDLQEIALKHGMLAPEIRSEPCGEWCKCNDIGGYDSDDWKRGVECYRRTALLSGGGRNDPRRACATTARHRPQHGRYGGVFAVLRQNFSGGCTARRRAGRSC